MTRCATTGTTTCSYLGTLGCEIPGWEEKMVRLSFLEGKMLHATASHQETLEYRSLSHETDPTVSMQANIYVGSCFCHPTLR